VGCWPEKAQQRVELWLGESDEHQQGVKRQLMLAYVNCLNNICFLVPDFIMIVLMNGRC